MNNPPEATTSVSAPAKKKFSLIGLADLFCFICLTITVVASICGFAGAATVSRQSVWKSNPLHISFDWMQIPLWRLELFSHFRIQYTVAAITMVLWFAIRRRPVALVLAAGVLVVNGLLVHPLFVKPAATFEKVATGVDGGGESDSRTDQDADVEQNDTEQAETVRIICANIYIGNSKPEGLLKLVEEERPEIVIVQEFTDDWGTMLEPLDIDYPYSLKIPNEGAFGIALYSRFRFDSLQKWDSGPGSTPGIIGRFSRNGRSMTLLTSHPVPPTSENYAARRNKQILAIGVVANATSGAFALCGDLNMSRWSPWFKELTSSGLRDGAEGFGLQTSWPDRQMGLPSIFRIQIDHCLVSKEVKVREFRVGPTTNSDHLPIIVDLEF